jgi:thiamine-phosphate pyrophosphorylase
VIPKLHVVTDDEVLGRRDILPRARKVLESGCDGVALHLRGPGTPGRKLFFLASSLLPVAQATGSLLLVNDRVDLALALDLPGAHLGQRSLPPDVARGLLGDQRILGLSVHGPLEVSEWEEGAVDFLFVGNVFATSSHPGRAPGGTGRIQEVAGVTKLPLFAIGGVTPERVSEVCSAGAFGVAVRSGIWDAEDPTVATEGYLMECRVSENGGRT